MCHAIVGHGLSLGVHACHIINNCECTQVLLLQFQFSLCNVSEQRTLNNFTCYLFFAIKRKPVYFPKLQTFVNRSLQPRNFGVTEYSSIWRHYIIYRVGQHLCFYYEISSTLSFRASILLCKTLAFMERFMYPAEGERLDSNKILKFMNCKRTG